MCIEGHEREPREGHERKRDIHICIHIYIYICMYRDKKQKHERDKKEGETYI